MNKIFASTLLAIVMTLGCAHTPVQHTLPAPPVVTPTPVPTPPVVTPVPTPVPPVVVPPTPVVTPTPDPTPTPVPPVVVPPVPVVPPDPTPVVPDPAPVVKPPVPTPVAVTLAPAACGITEKILPIVDHGAVGSSDCVYLPPVSNVGTQVVATAAGFKAALAAAKCGDTLLVPVAVYSITGNIVLKQVCTTPNLITVRTASPMSTLPVYGRTLTPAYAGYTSAPEVAAYPGPFVRVVPQIILNQNSRVSGGSGWRWLGLEVTVPQTATYYQSDLFDVSNNGHIIFDRDYVHGAPKAQITRAIFAAGSNHIAFIGSTMSDFHCIANGACTDSQTFGGGVGASGSGFDFLYNFLSAGAENIIFGGGGATSTATGVRVYFNHFYKPLSWEKNQPTYNNMNFSVKNLFELKNAQNVENIGNRYTNNWGGFSQPGYCILFTPKNQSGKAPGAIVFNVIFAYNLVENCGGGMQIASATDDGGQSSTGGGNISVHDILFDSIDGAKNFGDSTGLQITPMDPLAKFDNFYFGNLTFFGTPNAKAALEFGSKKMTNIVIVNSILNAGKYGGVRTGAKAYNGLADCSNTGGNLKVDTMMKSCWTNPVWINNLVVGNAVGAVWPAGTKVITTSPFVSATDPHVLPTYAGYGADIDMINTLMGKITY